MKYIVHLIIVFLAGWFIFCPAATADEIKGLTEIYDTQIPVEIRRNFNEYVQARESCSNETGGVVDGEDFTDIYNKKFLVIGLESNGFGGFWAMIAVENEARKAFRLWLYDIGDNVYDLRSIAEVPGCFDEQFVKKLRATAYSKFWL